MANRQNESHVLTVLNRQSLLNFQFLRNAIPYMESKLDEFRWKCPACFAPTNEIIAEDEARLEIEVVNHIRYHERTAALQAVDRARMQCQRGDCLIGLTRIWNLKEGVWEPRPTEFDLGLLKGLHVSW